MRTKNDMDKNEEKKQKETDEIPPQEVDEVFEELEHNETIEEVVKKTEFDALKQLANQLETNYKRALADYQNLQRRTQEQKAEWITSANKELLLKLLPVLDTLMLAGKHIDDKGLHISIDQFVKILEQEGLTRIKTIGEDFNPHTMECVTTQEGEEGKVLEEIRVGFMLYDQVLRSAQVIVGKKTN